MTQVISISAGSALAADGAVPPGDVSGNDALQQIRRVVVRQAHRAREVIACSTASLSLSTLDFCYEFACFWVSIGFRHFSFSLMAPWQGPFGFLGAVIATP
jgi:hypothetical protein